VARGKTAVAVSIALLPLWIGLVWGGILIVRAHHAKPAPWTSRARFTLSRVGSYTVADSTVPVGIHGHAEIALGMGLSGKEKDFDALIGDDPAHDTNVSQWELIFDGYHGVGSYTVASSSDDGGVRIMVRDVKGNTDTWDSDHSKAAGCAIHITADAPMKDPAIREIQGTVSCHALYDANRHTATTALSSHFDVFAAVWCRGPKVEPCRPPQPLPNVPED
jgi:hypothetical protein